MSRFFNIKTRDPLDAGYKVYKHTRFTINPGLTVLTGCNGAGKTTLIKMMKEDLKQNQILFTSYDNLHDGGGRAMDFALSGGFMNLLAGLAMSSEGESINMNLSQVLDRIVKYAKSNDPKDLLSKDERFSHIFHDPEYKTNEVWIFFDASDSGLSINAVIDFKKVLHHFIEGLIAAGKDPYVIVSANEYEMCDGEACFDVQNMKYVIYKTYKSYKKAILKSADYKYAEREKGEARRKAREEAAEKDKRSDEHGLKYRQKFNFRRDD